MYDFVSSLSPLWGSKSYMLTPTQCWSPNAHQTIGDIAICNLKLFTPFSTSSWVNLLSNCFSTYVSPLLNMHALCGRWKMEPALNVSCPRLVSDDWMSPRCLRSIPADSIHLRRHSPSLQTNTSSQPIEVKTRVSFLKSVRGSSDFSTTPKCMKIPI